VLGRGLSYSSTAASREERIFSWKFNRLHASKASLYRTLYGIQGCGFPMSDYRGGQKLAERS